MTDERKQEPVPIPDAKPCPFCGSTNVILDTPDMPSALGCWDCTVDGPFVDDRLPNAVERATAAWNSRGHMEGLRPVELWDKVEPICVPLTVDVRPCPFCSCDRILVSRYTRPGAERLRAVMGELFLTGPDGGVSIRSMLSQVLVSCAACGASSSASDNPVGAWNSRA